MKHRKLRIAWSVAWGVAAALLIVLWPRSYYAADGFSFPLYGNQFIVIGSVGGQFGIVYAAPATLPGPGIIHHGFNNGPPQYIKSKWVFTHQASPYPAANLGRLIGLSPC